MYLPLQGSSAASGCSIYWIFCSSLLSSINYSSSSAIPGRGLIKGLLVLGVVTVVSKVLDLHVINWMLQQGMTVILVALPVVFQPELRRALEQIGRGRFFRSGQVISMEELERLIDEIVAISESLSKTIQERSSSLNAK